MKILYVLPSVSPSYGGLVKAPLELAAELSRLGVNVDVIATNDHAGKENALPQRQWISREGYRVQLFPFLNFAGYKVSLSLANWLYRHVHEYDCVHIHGIFSFESMMAYSAAKRKKIPYLVTPHGMLEPWALNYKKWKKQPYYSFIEKLGLQKAQAAQALTSSEKANLHSLGLGMPVAVIPNGIKKESFFNLPPKAVFLEKFPETKGKMNILFLGRIDPKKGLDLLALAFRKIQRKFPNTHLIVAGPDHRGFFQTAKRFFKNENCFESVTFTGMLDPEMRGAVFAASDLYVCPSYSEGFSLSILEAMAAGLPCIMTRQCNFPEAALAGAGYEIDADAESLANALNQILENPKKALEMGRNARRFIFENYTWERIAPQMLEIYKSQNPASYNLQNEA